MPSTTVLISGANRGLGKGLLERYAAKENHTIIAANRDPKHPTSKCLHNISTGPGSRIIVVKLDASIESDADAAVEELSSTHGIDHLDLVIANAGIANVYPTVSQLKASDLLSHMTTNVLGLVWLFQATTPLLRKSTNPKWVTMGSGAALLEVSCRNMVPISNAAYAPTKTMAHWMTKKIDQEEEWLLALIALPGWVQTDLGNASARFQGIDQAPVTVDQSCDGVVQVIDIATKKTHGGRMWNYDGKQQSW
ncbi:NAD(P)-binding protein [Annulohypoxylon truncatum]|uniref:NAD(P)-binding protein n=1 Tax=Annulohypoxylon truncatum TaxID=327061 RepID=UPI002007A63F|nr:NAD(P)-binding protein [Annulohypoxylon truncatum]KAI1204854.1 NAD(P)-binding protein [Annulohypoxylon truncatum]